MKCCSLVNEHLAKRVSALAKCWCRETQAAAQCHQIPVYMALLIAVTMWYAQLAAQTA